MTNAERHDIIAFITRKTASVVFDSFKRGHCIMNKKLSTRMLASVAVCGAVSFILMMLDFGLPFIPEFIKFDFSDLPALICTFSFGPLAGVFVELIKNLLHLFVTSTMGIGELSNFLLGCALVVPAGMIYKHNKTRRTALIGMITGTLCFSVMGIISNYFIIFPFYTMVMHIPMEAIVAMGAKISPIFNSEFKLILLSVTPYNICKGLIVSILTFVLYKRLRTTILKG